MHSKALEYFKFFLIIGGMPEIVAKYIETQSIFESQKLLSNLTATLKFDFSKYRARVPRLRVNAVFDNAVAQMCNQFIYAKVEQDYHLSQIKECVELLVMAGLLIPVIHSAANGIPLGAEINLKKQKFLLIDTGLYQNLTGLNPSEILFADNFQTLNKSRIAELFAGLEILKTSSPFTQHQLYFWQREAKNSHAEVDYLLQKNDKIIPVEIKAGTKGSMQSLHLFMREKNSEKGIRCSLENFTCYDKIEVYPLYAISLWCS
jgi:predicted AAA+ superfamily ATPase